MQISFWENVVNVAGIWVSLIGGDPLAAPINAEDIHPGRRERRGGWRMGLINAVAVARIKRKDERRVGDPVVNVRRPIAGHVHERNIAPLTAIGAARIGHMPPTGQSAEKIIGRMLQGAQKTLPAQRAILAGLDMVATRAIQERWFSDAVVVVRIFDVGQV